MTTKTDPRLVHCERRMRVDQFETGIASASTCHGYFIRDGITTELLAALQKIAEASHE